jgi:hypothetical protein
MFSGVAGGGKGGPLLMNWFLGSLGAPSPLEHNIKKLQSVSWRWCRERMPISYELAPWIHWGLIPLWKRMFRYCRYFLEDVVGWGGKARFS